MQLIRIINVPIEYKMEIEHARLEMKQAGEVQADISQKQGQFHMKSRNIQMRMDSSEMRASLGLKDIQRFAADNAAKGTQNVQETTGAIMSDVSKFGDPGMSVKDIMASKLMDPTPQVAMTFLPTVGPAITWQPPDLQLDYEPGTVTFDWKLLQNTMEYIPGKFHLEILQYPDVQIEYLGGPNYVPPSASPDYAETEK
ncbi:MAG: DUF6470 family protein [Oscillospiraceae bacterium]|nr:DUF6470 family protein [Oscillospiraceae bacterium]